MDEGRLRDRDDPEPFHPIQDRRRAYAGVLDARPVPRGCRVGAERVLVRIQDHRNRAVADGVGGELKAGLVCPSEPLVQSLLVVDGDAAVARIVTVVNRHRGGTTAARPVLKQLGGTQPQPIVAETGLETQLHKRLQGVINQHHREDAHRQFPVAGQLLVGSQLL